MLDRLTILGIIIAVGGLVAGQFLEGGQLAALVNIPAAVIVLGGTIGAALIETPARTLSHACKLLPMAFFERKTQDKELVAKAIAWSKVVRQDGLLGLEPYIKREHDPFVQKAVQMIVDGAEADQIQAVLDNEMELVRFQQLNAVSVYESMGGTAPTIGIIAAVLGLIHVVGNLTDPALLGSGIAVAFVATIYGVGLANLILLPIAAKMRRLVELESVQNDLIVHAAVSIASGDNPQTVQFKLMSYVQE